MKKKETHSVANVETENKREPIYLVSTLINMPEIKRYSLHECVIRAILKDNNTFTLKQATALIDAYVKSFE
mgnify:CR=1 FL=1